MEDGINFTALREIKILKELHHPNIIELIDVFVHKSTIKIIYEFMDTDLYTVINDPNIILSEAHIKAYMYQILQGVAQCHKSWVLHRDLKPSNLLLSRDGVLKLADFGLAKVFGSPDREYTPIAVTRWYRPPELLFGANYYGPSVDMWSCGCLFAEMFLRRPYFPGESDLDQLGKIFAALGTPTVEQWPGMKSLPGYVEFEEFPATPFRILFSAASNEAIDLLSKFLQFNPAKRISAEDALKHPFFTTGVKATPLNQLPFPTKKIENKMDDSSPTVSSDLKRRRISQEDRMNISTSSIDSLDNGTRSVRRKLEL
jgi:cyclin-dependent kinase 7